jgi:hypothetical protein
MKKCSKCKLFKKTKEGNLHCSLPSTDMEVVCLLRNLLWSIFAGQHSAKELTKKVEKVFDEQIKESDEGNEWKNGLKN